ncbi:MAG: flagellar assembly protein H [Gammaproteobacteria bacterium]|nr:flagellar assembly protein H [Gammaproteobacteria bacterium]MBU0773490.1 flagellar assembly protein H [Gammaproteobacteria bacterium]MBU0856700.1 flagellar assembly protein H [Gammaproteobacteria bacterium]MBU1846770.1 flagellar assembly protein H [Gammaproteobacteria bacterium]
MKDIRPHRFPPLAQAAAAGRQAGQSVDRYQQLLADGFRQGMDEGFSAGREAGLAEGMAEGRASGHEEGMRIGREEAMKQAQDAFGKIAQPLDAMLAQLAQMQADYQLAQRKEVVDLVARVARQVIRCELALQPAQLLALVDETLAAIPPTRKVIEVYLNPEDLQRIRDIDAPRAARWKLLADARLDAGECLVKAGDHEADAGCAQRLAACVEQVRAQLLDGSEAPAPTDQTDAGDADAGAPALAKEAA